MINLQTNCALLPVYKHKFWKKCINYVIKHGMTHVFLTVQTSEARMAKFKSKWCMYYKMLYILNHLECCILKCDTTQSAYKYKERICCLHIHGRAEEDTSFHENNVIH
jgi:hypothetical protein